MGSYIDHTLRAMELRGRIPYDPVTESYTRLNGTKFYCTPDEMRRFAPIEIEIFSEEECDRILCQRTGSRRAPRPVPVHQANGEASPKAWYRRLFDRFRAVDACYHAQADDIVIDAAGSSS